MTQNGDIVLFTEVSTSPTTIIALNMCLWWGALDGHATSTADAVQAFLQSYLPEDEPTFVILPRQLWLNSWKSRFRGKVAVKVRKSLYGASLCGAPLARVPGDTYRQVRGYASKGVSKQLHLQHGRTSHDIECLCR